MNQQSKVEEFTHVTLIGEARFFLQKLVDAGYPEEQILSTLKLMANWVMEGPDKTTHELDLTKDTRDFVERLLSSGIGEDRILDALNQVAILLIKGRRINHEH